MLLKFNIFLLDAPLTANLYNLLCYKRKPKANILFFHD